MKLRYEQVGDYQLPMLQMDEQPEGIVTKYGLMRKNYLKKHKTGIYSTLLLQGKLKEHLLQIQEQAEERMEVLTKQMKESQGVTEQLKAEQPMLWVQKMNQIQHSIDELIQEELIYN